MNALSAFATNPWTNTPASNALKKIVLLLYTATTTTNTCVVSDVTATVPAKIEINLKAFG
jgi:hypothetical protein